MHRKSPSLPALFRFVCIVAGVVLAGLIVPLEVDSGLAPPAQAQEAPAAESGARPALRLGLIGGLNRFEMSPVSDYLAVTSHNTIQIRSLDSLALHRILPGHGGGTLRVKFSADGAFILSYGFDDRARLWETSTGRLVREFPGIDHEKVKLDVSSGGELVAISFDDDVKVWTRDQDEPKYVLEDFVERQFKAGSHAARPIGNLLFSPDGNRLVVISEAARVHDAATGRELAKSTEIIPGAAGFTPDGATLLLCWDSPGRKTSGITVLVTESMAMKEILLPKVTIECLSVLPDQDEVLVAGAAHPPMTVQERLDASRTALEGLQRGRLPKFQSFVARVNLKKGKVTKEVVLEGSIKAISSSFDGKTVVVDDVSTGVKFLKRSTLKEMKSPCIPLREEDAVAAFLCGPDGIAIVNTPRSGGESRPSVMQLGFNQEKEKWTCESKPLAGEGVQVTAVSGEVSAGVVLLATADGVVTVWSPSDGRGVTAIPMAPTRGERVQGIHAVGYGAEAERIVAGGRGWLGHCGVKSKKPESVEIPRHEGRVLTAMAFSRDGGQCAAVAPSGTKVKAAVALLDTQTGKIRRTFEAGEKDLTSCALSGDGDTLIAGDGAGHVYVWGTRGGERLAVLEGHSWQVTAIEFLDGKGLVATASEDGSIRTWNCRDWAPEAVMHSWGCQLESLHFDPARSRLIAASDAGTIEYWSLETGASLGRIAVPCRGLGNKSGTEWVALSADGAFAASSSGDNALCLLGPDGPVEDRAALESRRDPAEVWKQLMGE